jgi:ribosomal protein S18 acetylase RimI-like enzyme
MMSCKTESVDSRLLTEFANLHRTNYPSDHLTGALDNNLLIKYYGYFTDDDCKSYVYREERSGHVLGFIVAGTGLGKKISQFVGSERGPLLAFFIRNPIVLFKLLIKKAAASFKRAGSFSECDFLILSIVSDSKTRGVGSGLLNTLFADAKKSGFDKVGLYVTCTNTKAINFYFHKGFRIAAFCKGQYYMECSLNEDK